MAECLRDSGHDAPSPSPHISLINPLQGSALYGSAESSTARPARGQGIDYGFVSTVDAEKRRQGIRDVGYGIRDTWVDPAEAIPEIAPLTVGREDAQMVRSRIRSDCLRELARGSDFLMGDWDDPPGDRTSDTSYSCPRVLSLHLASGAALTWWNGQIRTLGPEAYAMTWEVLKKKMTDKYCPQGEIKKLEIELWNLKVRGNDIPALY
ncbi:reverse transcriptase domain-containing protein [Tanacetum coccineum]